MEPESVLSEEELEAMRAQWHAVDVVGLVGAVLPFVLHIGTTRTSTASFTVDGKTIESRHVEQMDYVALGGGLVAVLCAVVGLLMLKRFKRSLRAARFAVFAVLLGVGGFHVARGAGAFANRDGGPHESVAPPTPTAPPKPKRPENESLADQLRAQFPELDATVRCDVIAPGAEHTTCALDTDAGAPLTMQLDRIGAEWKIKSPERIASGPTIAKGLVRVISVKVRAPVEVDCGTGLVGISEQSKLTCAVTKKGSKTPGSVEVTFRSDGGYTWTATGL